jgi:hypothetical protein
VLFSILKNEYGQFCLRSNRPEGPEQIIEVVPQRSGEIIIKVGQWFGKMTEFVWIP